jgi:hypothetical protein
VERGKIEEPRAGDRRGNQCQRKPVPPQKSWLCMVGR